MEKNSAVSMLLLMAFAFLLDQSGAASFDVVNNCPYTVWAAAKPGGGSRLDTGEKWTLSVNETDPDGFTIWGRTGCTFDAHGRGGCETGDCGGVLECLESGKPPKTLAEFYMYDNTYSDITLVNGFNVPMTFRPDSSSCPQGTRGCAADITGLCPSELKAPGGCNNPCTVFNSTAYCEDHTATDFSKFFKDSCPHAYAYPGEFYSPTLTASCPPETNYTVEFCPADSLGEVPLEMA